MQSCVSAHTTAVTLKNIAQKFWEHQLKTGMMFTLARMSGFIQLFVYYS
jgi:hypothetical protein